MALYPSKFPDALGAFRIRQKGRHNNADMLISVLPERLLLENATIITEVNAHITPCLVTLRDRIYL